ncbi:MAG: BamA/TamA family outer membrane protein [Candidatus Eisenbacteria sp.]|nr:BamA/TamA family outer membrane protein [Candidatus Eisenbacteria bacterium]
MRKRAPWGRHVRAVVDGDAAGTAGPAAGLAAALPARLAAGLMAAFPALLPARLSRAFPALLTAGLAARLSAALLAFLLAVPLGVGAGRAGAQELDPREEPPKIEEIRFVGNERIEAGDLRGVMRLRQKSAWKPFQKIYFYGSDHLERDLERILALYRSEGYIFARIAGAQVEYRTPEWVTLQIEIVEGPRIHLAGARVAGVDEPLAGELARGLELVAGSPLREARAQEAEERLVRICQDRGYALAEVLREMRFQGDSVSVTMWVDPGPRIRVGAIRITGGERTKAQVIRRELRLRRGEVLRRSKVVAAQERLFDLGLFRSVRIAPTYGDSTVGGRDAAEVTLDLIVSVAEKPPGWFGFGVGISSADEARLVGEWGYRNLRGQARGVLVRTLLSYPIDTRQQGWIARNRERQLELSYTQPWLFVTPLRWQVGPYYRFHREPTFEEDIYGLLLGAHRQLGRFVRLIGSLENKWISTTDTTAARADYQIRFFSLALVGDRRDFVLDPRRGHLTQVRAEYAGGFLGGEASFARWLASRSAYLTLGGRFTWAHRIQVGYIDPIGEGIGAEGEERQLLGVPFDERFRAGGGTSVRGLAEKSLGPYSADGQPLGGLALLLLNTELRFDLFWQLGGAIFLDAGNVWEDYRQITWSRWTRAWTGDSYSELDAAYSIGGGVRLRTPVGPLRLDYGVQVSTHRRPGTRRGEWHFSLGQAF